MALTNSQVTVFANELQSSLKKSLVFAGPKAVNRDYQGEIKNEGDTVRIRSISRPTIGTYVKNVTSISFETLTDAERSLLIDQAKYFAFEIDDVDMAQVQNGGGIKSEAALEAAYGLADVADQYVAGLYTGADAANQISTTTVNTALLAATGLVNLKVKLDNANVPDRGRYAIVPPWYHGLLLLPGSGFVSVADAGTDEGLRNGHVGRAFGFDIMVSNNVVNVTGDDYRVSAGYTGAITFATQINSVETLRPESSFSDAVKGLNLYGSKLVRPTGIATLIASIT
jgi:hypothetical protein